MLRSTLTARILSLGGERPEILPCPLPEAADYVVRLASRARAEAVAEALRADGPGRIRRADAVGEGFLFVTPGPDAYAAALESLTDPAPSGSGERVLLEYVSADPNAALSLVHAREGVVGDALARLLKATGNAVWREYYVNDAPGAALKAFAASLGEEIPEVVSAARARQGAALARLGVAFDGDASENALRESGALEETLFALQKNGHAEERGGALWLRSSALGDDQDRVLKRPTGEATYLAGDLAYHRDKFGRGFTRLIDVWDSDHRGYVARTHAGLRALSLPDDRLDVLVCGPVRVLRDGTEVRGGRYGGFVSLEEALEDLSPGELRFALLRLAPDAPLDLSLDAPSGLGPLAALHRSLNRLRDAARPGAPDVPALLASEAAAALLRRLLDFPYERHEAAATLAPHRLARFAEELSTLAEALPDPLDGPLADAARRVLHQTLDLLGLAENERR